MKRVLSLLLVLVLTVTVIVPTAKAATQEEISFTYEVFGADDPAGVMPSGTVTVQVYMNVHSQVANIWGINLDLKFNKGVELVSVAGNIFAQATSTRVDIANRDHAVMLLQDMGFSFRDKTFAAGKHLFATLTFRVDSSYRNSHVNFAVATENCNVARMSSAPFVVEYNTGAKLPVYGVGEDTATAAHIYLDNGMEMTAFYDTLAEAMSAAESGTIRLLANAEASNVILRPGMTLDLNGRTLTAALLAVMKGAGVTDGANCTGGGLLKVAKEHLVFDKESGQSVIPVWNGTDGYLLTKVTFQQMTRKAGEGASQYILLPRLSNTAAAALLEDGGENNGLKIKVCMTWNGGQSQQFYTYSDDLVKQVFDGTGRWVFDLQVTGIAGINDMVASPIIVADSGAQTTTTGTALVIG